MQGINFPKNMIDVENKVHKYIFYKHIHKSSRCNKIPLIKLQNMEEYTSAYQKIYNNVSNIITNNSKLSKIWTANKFL